MTCKIIITIATATCLAATLASPAANGRPQAMDLSDVLDRSVCPMKLETDEDPDRIPRVINQTRCAADPVGTCKAHGIPPEACCPHVHGDHFTECVEIRDTLYVLYPGSATPDVAKAYEVSVGCACVHSQGVPADVFSR